LSIQIVRTLSEDEWRRFVDQHPESNIFHTPEMYQVFERAEGHQPELWAATNAGCVLALLLVVRVTLISGLLRHLTTRAVAYGGVLSDPSAEGRDALGELLAAYKHGTGHGLLFTELRHLSDSGSVQPILRANAFVYEDHLNYLIDLALPPEEVLQNIGARTRKNIRRGLRRGEVEMKELEGRASLVAWYDLLRQTYRAAGVPLADRSLFEAAFDLLRPKGMVRFTWAHVNGSPAAISVELIRGDTVYGWYGGVNRAFSKWVPNELLTWHILKWGAENGYRVYDFGGAGKPDEDYGVRDFKAKFGGELVCYGRNTCVHSPTGLAISKAGYEAYRTWRNFRT
jgi:lipid II:glycine glycyltransferase (peptidoglycan interpeptide bridge formation enzyme)